MATLRRLGGEARVPNERSCSAEAVVSATACSGQTKAVPAASGLTLHEAAVIAGCRTDLVDLAVEVGAIWSAGPSWGDILVLRVFAAVADVAFLGEPPIGDSSIRIPRTLAACFKVRQGAERDLLAPTTNLLISPEDLVLLDTLGEVGPHLELERRGTLVLPVGRWWADLRWCTTNPPTALVMP